EGKLRIQVTGGGVGRNYHLDAESRRCGKAFTGASVPDEIPPRTDVSVYPEDFNREPVTIVEIALFPALGRAFRRLPRAVTDPLQRGQAIGNIADACEQPGWSRAVLRLNGDHVLAVNQLTLYVELIDPLPVISAADLCPVDPDGKLIVCCDIQSCLIDRLLHVAVNGKGCAKVTRFRWRFSNRITFVVPDPLEHWILPRSGGLHVAKQSESQTR